MMQLITITIICICILLSMTLHEAAHAYVSYWLGDDTAKVSGRLTLNPLAHVDPVMTLLLPIALYIIGLPPFGAAKPIPFNPVKLKYDEFGSALVGISGPIMNLLLAMLAGLILQMFGLSLNTLVGSFLYLFVVVNASFFLFNIIPFPPLDGSRVLYAFAPDFIRRAYEWAESIGVMSVLIFFLFFSAVLIGPFSALLYKLVSLLTGGQYMS